MENPKATRNKVSASRARFGSFEINLINVQPYTVRKPTHAEKQDLLRVIINLNSKNAYVARRQNFLFVHEKERHCHSEQNLVTFVQKHIQDTQATFRC
jgi:hypothetical protein